MKKILFVIPEYSQGGTNKSLENLLSLIDKNKYDIKIFCIYEDGGDYYKKVFAPYIIEKSRLYYILHDNVVTRKAMGIYNRITKRNNFSWLYKREINIIQSHYLFDKVIAYQEGLATYFVSYFYEDVSKIAWVHCDYKDWANENQKKYDKSIYQLYKKIVCVSETSKESFCSVFPEHKEKSISIYNALNDNAIEQMSNCNICFPFSDNTFFNILSVGRLTDVKQFDKIPLIVSTLDKKAIGKIRWYVIGEGYQKEMISNEIKKRGLENTIFLLGPHDNPYPYFKLADLFVCTSDSESFSYTIFESKILHTPVLSNNFPVAYEVLDKNCGWICSIEEMPYLLSKIINDKGGVYSQMKEKIKNYKYSNNDTVKKIELLLKGIS